MSFQKEKSDYQLFDQLITGGVSFALFRLPGQNEVQFVCQTSLQPYTYHELLAANIFRCLSGKSGFMVAPFHIGSIHPVAFIPSDIHLQGEEKILAYLRTLKMNFKQSTDATNHIADELVAFSVSNMRQHYQKAYAQFHAKLVDRTFEKLVLSRTLDIPRPAGFSAGEVFQKACQRYPHNFIYLFHHGACGTWLGCTPEIILAGEHGHWTTDALAGTQAIDTHSDREPVIWDKKNRDEQQIVVNYMQQQLLLHGITSDASQPITIRSGHLAHLRSRISFNLTDEAQVLHILHTLHPSPAVCGSPKQPSFDFIVNNEGYDRAYYAGFIGHIDVHNHTDLFVNLRCMQICGHHLRLYAGGGVMASSELETEWVETNHKLQTILSLLPQN